MPITDIQIKALQSRDKRYLVSDGRGLSLDVLPSGFKSWIYRYTLGGKDKIPSLVLIPVNLSQPREVQATSGKPFDHYFGHASNAAIGASFAVTCLQQALPERVSLLYKVSHSREKFTERTL